MISAEYVQTLAAYNTDMNNAVYGAAEQLDIEERERDRGAFFGSVVGTLNHLLWADGMWMSRFEEQARPPGGFTHRMAERWETLKILRVAMDRRIESWAQTLSPDWLEAPFHWVSSSGKKGEQPAWLLVTHLFNHSTHHRGQLSTLLFQRGIDIGVTDLPMVRR